MLADSPIVVENILAEIILPFRLMYADFYNIGKISAVISKLKLDQKSKMTFNAEHTFKPKINLRSK